MLKTMLGSLIGILLVALAGCATAPPAPAVDVATEQAKLRDLEATWVKELAAKDLDKTISHYTADATLIAPGVPAFQGVDAIRAGVKGLLDDPNFKLNFSSDRVEVSKSGDLAFTKGTYASTATNPKTKKPMEDKGSYATIFMKQADGSWKAVVDINTSEVAH